MIFKILALLHNNWKRSVVVFATLILVIGVISLITLAILSNDRVHNLSIQYDGNIIDNEREDLVHIVNERLDHTAQQVGFWGNVSLDRLYAFYSCEDLVCTLDLVGVVTLAVPQIYFPLQPRYYTRNHYRIDFDGLSETISPGDQHLTTSSSYNPEWGDYEIQPEDIFNIVFQNNVIRDLFDLDEEMAVRIYWSHVWKGNWCVDVVQEKDQYSFQIDQHSGITLEIPDQWSSCF